MSQKMKTADSLKVGDIFALKTSDISYNLAKVKSVAKKEKLEVEISYEFSYLDKKQQRRVIIPSDSVVLSISSR